MKKILMTLILGLLAYISANADQLIFVDQNFPADQSSVAMVYFSNSDKPVFFGLTDYDLKNQRYHFDFWDQIVAIQKTQPLTYITSHKYAFQLIGNDLIVLDNGVYKNYRFYMRAPVASQPGTCPSHIFCH